MQIFAKGLDFRLVDCYNFVVRCRRGLEMAPTRKKW